MDAATAQALLVFGSAFGVSAFAGLATVLRFGKQLNLLTISAGMLNSGFLGLTIVLFWYEKFLKEGNIYGLVAICVMAGLGGSTITDFLVDIVKKGGLHITIARKGDDEVRDDNRKGD